MHREILTTLLRQGRRDLALAYVSQYVSAKRGLFYHGTSSVLAKRILSEGFVPDPKKKIWDGETGTSESYTGTYFTAWPHTAGRYAGGAVRKFGGFEVIFEVQLETKTGVFDEDEIAPVALSVMMAAHARYPAGTGLTKILAENVLNDKRQLGALVEDAVTGWIGTGDESSPRAMPFAYLYRQRYGDAPINPNYWNAVYAAAKRAAVAFLEDVRDTGSTDGKGPRYRKAETELFKAINLSRYGPQQRGGPHNIRVTEPVGFRGANKIVAAVGDQWKLSQDGQRTRIVHILYGKPSAELLKPRRDEKVVVKRGWPKPTQQKMAARVQAGTFDDRIDEMLRDQAKQRHKKIGIDGDRGVTDQIEVSQSVPGRVWSFWFKDSGMEIVRVNGLKRARAMRAVLRDSGLRDFRKLRELAFDWRKKNPR